MSDTEATTTDDARATDPQPVGADVPTAEELADYGHDFSAVAAAARERLTELAACLLASAANDPQGEVVDQDSVDDVTVSGYLRRLVRGFGEVIEALALWPAEEQLYVVEALWSRCEAMREHDYFDLRSVDVARWLDAHRPDADADRVEVEDSRTAVRECIQVFPPREVRITRRLAQTGAQKVVFEADWHLGDETRHVVLKRVLKDDASEREARAHPLVMQHPNIVRTYTVKNEIRPPTQFFLERFMEVREDSWRSEGLHEAARILADIARALAFLGGQGLVHGDVKPDNIGVLDGRYVLLDLGVCRSWIKFLEGGEGTGSTRTRAPEVLRGEPNSFASDVWSLGATVFRFLIGRFPLFETRDEAPPHALDPSTEQQIERERFRERLIERVETQWETLISSELVAIKAQHLRFGELLEDMLAREAADRPSASLVVDHALRYLPCFVGDRDGPLFPPLRELAQFRAYTTDRPELLRLIPRPKRAVWMERVVELKQELDSEHAEQQFLEALDLSCKRLLKRRLSDDARRAFEAVSDEIQTRRDAPTLYEDLYSAVDSRLKQARREDTVGSPERRSIREDTLGDALDHALAFPEVDREPNFARVARALREISHTSIP